jgi:H2-forming N5,N10-methylenetetrahydromethanopterin dehydrogenase-like enzyme
MVVNSVVAHQSITCVSVIFGVTIVHVFSKYGFKTIYVFCQQKSQHINAPKHIAEQNFNQTSLKQIADTIGSKAIDGGTAVLARRTEDYNRRRIRAKAD